MTNRSGIWIQSLFRIIRSILSYLCWWHASQVCQPTTTRVKHQPCDVSRLENWNNSCLLAPREPILLVSARSINTAKIFSANVHFGGNVKTIMPNPRNHYNRKFVARLLVQNRFRVLRNVSRYRWTKKFWHRIVNTRIRSIRNSCSELVALL